MRIHQVFFAVSGCIALLTPAFAQNTSAVNIDPFFTILDANKDGSIGKGRFQRA
jgi:hypothetical protein